MHTVIRRPRYLINEHSGVLEFTSKVESRIWNGRVPGWPRTAPNSEGKSKTSADIKRL